MVEHRKKWIQNTQQAQISPHFKVFITDSNTISQKIESFVTSDKLITIPVEFDEVGFRGSVADVADAADVDVVAEDEFR